MLSKGKKEEGSGELGIFTNIDKALVIQDAKIFNDIPLKIEKCFTVLTKLLYLSYQGEVLSSRDATNVFFAITKSFQSKDPNLRRLIYLVIKELAGTAQDIIMVISSLTQDMNLMPQFKANAIRALGTVVDSSMISGVERVLKQAMNDRNPSVVASAFTTAIHFFAENREAVRRWLPEVQAATQAGHTKTTAQYHALGLLYLIKQHDRMALCKLVQSIQSGACHMLATTLVLRIYNQLLNSSDSSFIVDLKPFLRMKGKGDMVALEAAKVICAHSNIYAADIVFAITTLQMFLGSNRALLRFAALRVLNEYAATDDQARINVAVCNGDIEGLISDPNRNVATLAITTLLKTGNENSVDRLITQITGYVSEISDEFKATVVEAVRSLGLKFPQKIESMLGFLGSVLREEGGLAYKSVTVNAIFDLLGSVPSARDSALSYLCEFIEDCEYPTLTVQILHFLGEEGPHSANPARLVRYIYNRLILEDAQVRSAAVGALSKIAAHCPAQRSGIVSILQRALEDSDDDVRDRAVISLQTLKDPASTKMFLMDDMMFDIDVLEAQLCDYIKKSEAALSLDPLDFSVVPLIAKAKVFEKARFVHSSIQSTAVSNDAVVPEKTNGRNFGSSLNPIATRSEFKDFGQLLHSSKFEPLTEAESEYVVNCRKHIYNDHLLLEFECRNTVSELILTNVNIHVNVQSETKFGALFSLPINSLPYDAVESCFVVYAIDNSNGHAAEATFECSLRFTATEFDTASEKSIGRGTTDEYPINSVNLGFSDYICERNVASFSDDWARLDNELVETLELSSMQTINEAQDAILNLLGLSPHRDGDVLNVESMHTTTTHTLFIAGTLLTEKGLEDATDSSALAAFGIRARFAMTNGGVIVEFAIRSVSSSVSSKILGAIC